MHEKFRASAIEQNSAFCFGTECYSLFGFLKYKLPSVSIII